jgi:ABC-type Zn uptake system ZnuABC Zn-binding protein ZnuA
MEYQMVRAIVLCSAFLLLATAACSGGDRAADGKLRVVATTTQIGDFARQVGGDRIALTVLLKPNQDAHDFAPSPSQVRALNGADVILRNGVGLDTFVTKAISGTAARVVVTTEGLRLREAGDEGHEDAGEDEDAHAEAAGRDPHVWFSVGNARRMVESIRDSFAAADAANGAYYRENARLYLERLDRLDVEIRQSIAQVPVSCRKLVTNHDVLGYYAETYGFEVVGSVIPGVSTEARPSASDIAEVVRLIRTEAVPAIFAETSNNPALIRQVGREAGVKVVDDLYGDSLGPSGSKGGTYIGMMQSNTTKIVGALKDCR